MNYGPLEPTTREEAERAFAGDDAEAIGRADAAWVQEQCLRLASHRDVWVRRNVATSLGHLARLHGSLDLKRVLPLLQAWQREPAVAGAAADALDDIAVFMQRPVSRGAEQAS
jgi:hypothetical protein